MIPLLTGGIVLHDGPAMDEAALKSLSIAKRTKLCLGLYHAIDLLREVINAFHAVEGDDVRATVLKRVGQVLVLEEALANLLVLTPTFSPPLMDGLYELLGLQPGATLHGDPFTAASRRASGAGGRRGAAGPSQSDLAVAAAVAAAASAAGTPGDASSESLSSV